MGVCLSPSFSSFSRSSKLSGSFLSENLTVKMASFFSSFVEMIVPKLRAEEEEEEPEAEPEAEAEAEEEEEEEDEDEEDLVDPHDTVREDCAKDHCAAIKARLDECNARVESKSSTTETCFEEILDFYHCIDHCASKIILTKLK